MDETLLHSRFYKLTGEEEKLEPGMQPDENNVLEFNVLISNKPN